MSPLVDKRSMFEWMSTLVAVCGDMTPVMCVWDTGGMDWSSVWPGRAAGQLQPVCVKSAQRRGERGELNQPKLINT